MSERPWQQAAILAGIGVGLYRDEQDAFEREVLSGMDGVFTTTETIRKVASRTLDINNKKENYEQ